MFAVAWRTIPEEAPDQFIRRKKQTDMVGSYSNLAARRALFRKENWESVSRERLDHLRISDDIALITNAVK